MNLNKFTINAGDKEKAKITGSGILDATKSNLQIEFKDVSGKRARPAAPESLGKHPPKPGRGDAA